MPGTTFDDLLDERRNFNHTGKMPDNASYRTFLFDDKLGAFVRKLLPEAPRWIILSAMILRPKSSPVRHEALSGVASGFSVATVPAWLRSTVPDAKSLECKDVEDIALAAGAAIGALDTVIRRQERWAGVWRQRLALSAAATTARQAGRVEDESALRDAVVLTHPGDDVGPAGRMFQAWRWLTVRPATHLLTEASIAGVLDALGLACNDETAAGLANELRHLAEYEGAIRVITGAFAAAERRGLPRIVGSWFADALLAQRLGWTHAVPLLGLEVNAGLGVNGPRRSGTAIAANFRNQTYHTKSLLAAQACTALRAVDQSAQLGRRADRLLAVAPKLRAKGADAVVERLLSNDAIVPSEKIAGISDRGLRRLFDRLVDLDAVRELSGRSTFRIYGL